MLGNSQLRSKKTQKEEQKSNRQSNKATFQKTRPNFNDN